MGLEEALGVMQSVVDMADDGDHHEISHFKQATAVLLLELERRSRSNPLSDEDAHNLAMMRMIR